MEKVTFINSQGVSLTFEGDALLSINGLGDVEADNQSQKAPYQDGSTHIRSSLKERPIDIQFLIRETDYKQVSQRRSEIASITNPKLGLGLIRYENDFCKREIYAVAEGVPAYPDKGNRGAKWQKGMISFNCPNPYWLSENDQVDELAVYEGGLTFPLTLSTMFSRQSENKSKIVTNEGDVEAPLLVTFTGPATAPIRISNETTGEFIEVNQDLLSGEKLVINTEFGKKKVMKVDGQGNEINAFHYINLQSTFFQLIQGNNLLSYSTGADYERAPVVITWRNRYVGV